MGFAKVEAVQMDKVRNEQIRIFRNRVRPSIDVLSEGVNIVRGIKGLKRPVTDPSDVKWSDIIQFSHPKISDIRLWDAFYEKYAERWTFNTNPLENKVGFIKELHDLIEYRNRSRLTPNNFSIVRYRPQSIARREVATGNEKFESEKFPKEYKVLFTLEWVVKA